jgi:hypothetical protein
VEKLLPACTSEAGPRKRAGNKSIVHKDRNRPAHHLI